MTGRNQIKVLRVRRKGCDKLKRKQMCDLGWAQQACQGCWSPRSPARAGSPFRGGSGGGKGNTQMVLKAPHCLVTGKHRGASGSPRPSLVRILRSEQWDGKKTQPWNSRRGHNAWTSWKGESTGSLWITQVKTKAEWFPTLIAIVFLLS